jgi:hypothetical protein
MKRYTPFLTAALVAGFAVSTMAQPYTEIQQIGDTFSAQVAIVDQQAMGSLGFNNTNSVIEDGINLLFTTQIQWNNLDNTHSSGNNSNTTVQLGDYNQASFLQTSRSTNVQGDNSVELLQDGDYNYANVYQDGALNNTADITQEGNHNYLVGSVDIDPLPGAIGYTDVSDMIDPDRPASQWDLFPQPRGHNTLTVDQQGNHNEIGLSQGSDNSGTNSGDDRDNTATFNQDGEYNLVGIAQTGARNTVESNQNGSRNEAFLVQESEGGSNVADITQDGDDNRLFGADNTVNAAIDIDKAAYQSAAYDASNKLVLNQVGNNNDAGMFMQTTGGLNDAVISQTGTNNISASWQSSTVSQFLSVTQTN